MSLLDAELRGTHLVEASAGTGKTHAITTLFVRFLLEHELGVEQILVVTYTNAATAELRDRIRSRIASKVESIAASSLFVFGFSLKSASSSRKKGTSIALSWPQKRMRCRGGS